MQTIKLGTFTAADANALNIDVNSNKAFFTLGDNYTPIANFIKQIYVKFNAGFQSTSSVFPTFDLKINEDSLMTDGAIPLNAVQPEDIIANSPLTEVIATWTPKIGQMKFPAPADNYLEFVFPNNVNPQDFTAGSISFYATVEDFQV